MQRPIGESTMESLDTNGPEEIIWPKPSSKQRLIHVGDRTEREPALLTCNGGCSKPHVKWTWHHMVNSSSFQCDVCKTTRRWGLGFGFGNG